MVSFVVVAVALAHPIAMLISSALLGIGIGLAFSALGNLIVGAVEPTQTGVASGMNTVMRTLGGALGGQISATFVVHSISHGLAAQSGFTETFVMSTIVMGVCVGTSLLVPGARLRRRALGQTSLARVPEVS
jgi:MFS family permease